MRERGAGSGSTFRSRGSTTSIFPFVFALGLYSEMKAGGILVRKFLDLNVRLLTTSREKEMTCG